MSDGGMVAARQLLARAVELDTAGRKTEAVICYQEGIQMLMDAAKGEGVGERERERDGVISQPISV